MHLPKERRNQLRLRLSNYVNDTTREEQGGGRAREKNEETEREKREAGTGNFEKKTIPREGEEKCS